MTIADVYDRTRKLINFYSASGTPLPARGDDTWPRAAALLDAAQREFARLRPRLRTVTLQQMTLKNLLPALAPVYVGATPVTMAVPDAASLTLSTAGPVEVSVLQTFRGSPMELASLSCPAGENRTYGLCFNGFAGGGDITLQLSGGPAYVWDLAMFAEAFDDPADVPPFGAYRWQALPAGCVRVVRVDLRPAVGAAVPDLRDYRVAPGRIGLPWDFDGTAVVTVVPTPAPITEESDAADVLELDDDALDGMAFYTAAWLVAEENPGLHALCMDAFREQLRRFAREEPVRGVGNVLFRSRERGVV